MSGRINQKTFIRSITLLMVIGLVALSTLGTAILTHASMANYPGGVALTLFNALYENKTNG